MTLYLSKPIFANQTIPSGDDKNVAAWDSLRVCASDPSVKCKLCSEEFGGGTNCCRYANIVPFGSTLPSCVDPKTGETCKPNGQK